MLQTLSSVFGLMGADIFLINLDIFGRPVSKVQLHFLTVQVLTAVPDCA